MGHPSLRKATHAGFTLIELLVVLTVVAVLVAVAFPVYHKITGKAKAAGSMSNLRQIGAGVPLYVAENNNRLPPGWNKAATDGTRTRAFTYAQYLCEYVYGFDAFDHEPDTNPSPARAPNNIFISPAASRPPLSVGWGFPITYSANPGVCPNVSPPPPGSSAPTLPPVSLFAVKRLNEVIMLIDGGQNPGNHYQANATFWRVNEAFSNSGGGLDQPISTDGDEDSTSGNGNIRYPDGFATALMVDGSVRKFAKGTITKGNVYKGEG